MEPRRFAAFAGIAWVLVTAVGVGAFALAGTPPAFSDGSGYATFISRSSAFFLTDAFAGGVGSMLLIAFVVGLATTLRAIDARANLAAALLFGFGIAVAGMLAIVATLETATVYVATTTAYAALTAPFFLATQTVVVFLYFPAVGFFVTLASSGSRTGLLPRWTSRLSWLAAGLLASATLATFGGTGAFGPLGILQVLLGFLPAAITFLAVSISMARNPAS